jgi:hypothetical protein
MDANSQRYDTYPWRKILPRWFFGAVEAGLSTYIVIGLNVNLGLIFSSYWAFSMLVLLPLIRCTKCYYYGKRCNTGWGLLASFAFPRGEEIYFRSGYALTFLLWPLRILPIGISLLNLIDGLTFIPDGLFGIYILMIILHRVYYRASNCPGCHQKEVCPVYDPSVLVKKIDRGVPAV